VEERLSRFDFPFPIDIKAKVRPEFEEFKRMKAFNCRTATHTYATGIQFQEARRLIGGIGRAVNNLARSPAAAGVARELDAIGSQVRQSLRAQAVGLDALKHDYMITLKVEKYGDRVVKLVEGAKVVDKDLDARFEYCAKIDKEENTSSKPSGRGKSGHQSTFKSGDKGGHGGAKRRRRSREKKVYDKSCFICGSMSHQKRDCKAPRKEEKKK
jgi:hypothetical protein